MATSTSQEPKMTSYRYFLNPHFHTSRDCSQLWAITKWVMYVWGYAQFASTLKTVNFERRNLPSVVYIGESLDAQSGPFLMWKTPSFPESSTHGGHGNGHGHGVTRQTWVCCGDRWSGNVSPSPYKAWAQRRADLFSGDRVWWGIAHKLSNTQEKRRNQGLSPQRRSTDSVTWYALLQCGWIVAYMRVYVSARYGGLPAIESKLPFNICIGKVKSSQVKSSLVRQGGPFSSRVVTIGALRNSWQDKKDVTYLDTRTIS